MTHSFYIRTILGCRFRLHWSWPALPVGVAGYSLATRGWHEAVFFLLLLVAIYVSVCLHELTRLVVARQLGLGSRDCTLYPFWGVARWTRQGERPRSEKHIAVVGLCVLLSIPISLLVGLYLAELPTRFPAGDTSQDNFITYWFWASLGLVAFHSLPLLPLDCGQIFRAMLAMRMRRIYATEAAAAASTVGAGFLLALAFASLKSPLLGTTAVLLYLGAQQELGSMRFFESIRRKDADPSHRPATFVPVDQVATRDCEPRESDFTGFIWHPTARLWIEWRDGKAVSANILIGDGGP